MMIICPSEKNSYLSSYLFRDPVLVSSCVTHSDWCHIMTFILSIICCISWFDILLLMFMGCHICAGHSQVDRVRVFPSQDYCKGTCWRLWSSRLCHQGTNWIADSRRSLFTVYSTCWLLVPERELGPFYFPLFLICPVKEEVGVIVLLFLRGIKIWTVVTAI